MDAASAAAVRSVVKAATTVSNITAGGWMCDVAQTHPIKYDMHRCQRLQKVQPAILGSAVLQRTPRVFSPESIHMHQMDQGLATGSPSRPFPRPGGFPPEGQMESGIPSHITPPVGISSCWRDVGRD